VYQGTQVATGGQHHHRGPAAAAAQLYAVIAGQHDVEHHGVVAEFTSPPRGIWAVDRDVGAIPASDSPRLSKAAVRSSSSTTRIRITPR
jgi:hypothetical protein